MKAKLKTLKRGQTFYGAGIQWLVLGHTNSSQGLPIVTHIVSTGIVSNMMTTVNDYYYNSTLAHCVYYGSTVTEHGHHHLHGEVVSLGVLCLLEHAGQFEEEDRLMKFNDSIGLPVCFDDVEIQESEFDKMADKFMQTTEWAHMPQGVTRENFLESMRRENAKGRAFKAAKK